VWCSELESLLARIAPEAASVEELCTLLNGFMRGREETRERGDYLDEEEDEEDGGGGGHGVPQAQLDLTRALHHMIRHLRPRLGDRLDLLREEIRKFKAGAEDESRPGAARVVKLSTVHKAKGLGFHRVYLLQPHDLVRGAVLHFAPDWHKRLEVNTAFVAQTRAYQELIFLQQVPSDKDLASLWPQSPGQRGPSARRRLKMLRGDGGKRCMQRWWHPMKGCSSPGDPHKCAQCEKVLSDFAALKLEPPKADLVHGNMSWVDLREVLHQSIARQFRLLALEVHPDRSAVSSARAKFQDINNARDRLLGWVVELCDRLEDER